MLVFHSFFFYFRNKEEKKFVNAVILEELCKELVAVLFVKYHHSNYD